MATVQRFEDLIAWEKARGLVREIYSICATTGLHRDYGLKDQICRAAVSAMSNIAEGFGRRSDNEFARFLDIASASAAEVQSLLYVALDTQYINNHQFEHLYDRSVEVRKLIAAFRSYLRNK